MMTEISREGDPSLKDGLGARHVERNPRAGIKPLSDFFMQIVPPVMIINTLDSGLEEDGLLMEMVALEMFFILKQNKRMYAGPKML